MSVKAIESWIDQTLDDSEKLTLNPAVLQPKKRNNLVKYGIDRQMMSAAGLSTQEADNIYRGLFVHALGFFETIR